MGTLWQFGTALAAMGCMAATALPATRSIITRLGGDFRGEPEDAPARLSPAARALIEQAFSDVGSAPLEDYHAHLVGIGSDGSHAELNPKMTKWWHPVRYVQARVYLSASGIRGVTHSDREYVDRLARLARGFGHPIRIHLLAMDHYYKPDGSIDREKTQFYVPNESVFAAARQHPGLFVPVISVHPDRPDALAELEKWSRQGVRYVKWLPNAQGIDPAAARYDAFYRRMRELDMVLLTHTGNEGAVHAAASQEFGNPLRLRRPLDAGVRVIMAHCASRGRNEDLDHPGVRADSFALAMRMLNDPGYRGLLFADISAMTQWNRLPRPLLELMRHPEMHDRLVNGSDYPMPAVNCVISLAALERRGMVTADERRALREIYDCNPLLFDFVLKRTVRDPVTRARLPTQIFLANPHLSGILAAHLGVRHGIRPEAARLDWEHTAR